MFQQDFGGLPERGELFVDRIITTTPVVGEGFCIIKNLDINRDISYRFLITGRNNTASADSFFIGYNGDYAFGSTNYTRNGFSILNGGQSFPNSANPASATITANADFIIRISVFAPDSTGRIRSIIENFGGPGGTGATRVDYLCQTWLRGSGENVTEIGFTVSNSILLPGTRIRGKVDW